MAFVLGNTIAQVFIERTRKSPGTVAFRYRSTNDVVAPRGEWRDVTFHTFKQECEQASLGLKAAGIVKGDHVAILSKTRYEWTLADIAIIGSGSITVPIYPSSTEAETIHLLQHSEAKAVFVEDESQLMKLIPHLDKLPLLKKIIQFESDRANPPSGVTPFFQLLKEGEAERHHSPNYFEETLRAVQPADLFTIS